MKKDNIKIVRSALDEVHAYWDDDYIPTGEVMPQIYMATDALNSLYDKETLIEKIKDIKIGDYCECDEGFGIEIIFCPRCLGKNNGLYAAIEIIKGANDGTE